MIYLTAFLVPLVYVFLRVFQQKNITQDQELLMIITSYGITAGELLTVTLIVTKGWDIYLPLGTGGAVGCILAARFHKKFFSKKNEKKYFSSELVDECYKTVGLHKSKEK